MKKTNESGRSMVEMLGVLAIIGVLSVGGIAGYTMAMNRYRANELIDLANKYALLLYTARQTNIAMGKAVSSSPAFTIEQSGLLEGTSSTMISTISSAITATDVNDDGTTITINFGSTGRCRAGASILGVTCTSGTSLSGILFNASGGTTGGAAPTPTPAP